MRIRRLHPFVAVSLAAALAVAAGPAGARAGQAGDGRIAYGWASIHITREDTRTVDDLEGFATPGRTPLVGDFAGDATDLGRLDDILWYTPGAGGDQLWRTTGARSWIPAPVSISGTYTPILGWFRADGKQDILWYAPGTGGDFLWDFNDDGSITNIPLDIDAVARPVVGYFEADGAEDILFYVPGTGADVMWDWNPDATITKRSLTVNGTYTPVVGSFAGFGPPTYDRAQDILWYAPGTTPDALWDFNTDGTLVKRSLTVNGQYAPVAGNFSADGFEDVLWYAPGSGADALWDFDSALLARTNVPVTVNGTYTPLTGSLFADVSATTDILWFGVGGRADTIWDFTTGSTHVSRPISLVGDRTPVLGGFEIVEWQSGPGQTSWSSGDDVIDLST